MISGGGGVIISDGEKHKIRLIFTSLPNNITLSIDNKIAHLEKNWTSAAALSEAEFFLGGVPDISTSTGNLHHRYLPILLLLNDYV